MTKAQREQIKMKYGGLCAYSGTPLEDDWQVDHIFPIIRDIGGPGCMNPERDCPDNMVPCQKIINHYKGSLPLETFRNWFLGGLHERLAKLPKNPRTDRSIKRSAYLNKVAGYFGITPDKPFSGRFYFEIMKEKYSE